MYLPTPYKIRDAQELRWRIRAHPFGTLITVGAAGLSANAIPWIIDGPGLGVLRGHVARANPVWRDHDARIESLVVFNGPDSYITPTWYATTRETGKVVPTWNYVTVQARGRLLIHDDAGWVRRNVEELTHFHEATRQAPWSVSDAPPDFIDGLLKAIVGVEIELTSLVGKKKASQGRPAADVAGVIEGLRDAGAPFVTEMTDGNEASGR